MADYEALIGRAVVAVHEDGEEIRGFLEAGISVGIAGFAEAGPTHPMIHTFDGSGSYWSSRWTSVTGIPLERLTRAELLAWHEMDPLAYLKAGFAWVAGLDSFPASALTNEET
jgi:hypothetical protein